MADIRYCCVCGRQIVSHNISNDVAVGGTVTMMGPNQFCCHECAEGLDENGVFPEEY